MNKRFLIIASLIFVASFSRLLTNYFGLWNFTPVAAMALFAGANFRDKKFAFIVPFAAMFLTDLFLGLHAGMFYVYGAFALITFIGMWLEKRQKVQNIIAASLLSSLLFFIITNFAAWLASPVYTQNISGLITCYVAAIPFFGNSIAGDLFFCGVLFGGFALLKVKMPELVKA